MRSWNTNGTCWVVTDTHLGHKQMLEYCNRPPDFSEQIINYWMNNVKPDDTVIHLGDVAWPNYYDVLKDLPGHKILVRGNHDKKSNSWYEDQRHGGFDFVCTEFARKVEGIDIIFTHIPLNSHSHDINVCGHLHGNHHNAGVSTGWVNPVLSLSLEESGYKLLSMEEVMKMVRKVLKEWES